MTAEEIRTPSPRNRQISFPYTKFMNANMSVDMAAALFVCSYEKAKTLGIAEDRFVYPHSGVEGYDHFSASVRDNFYTSPGVRITGTRAMDLAGIDVGDLDFVDLYSCFPSAVQIAAWELGLPEERPLTVTGGLTFGGGPLNNYVMHSIARTVELLREKPDGFGLVTGNGGNLYKHAHGIYSGTPPRHDFQHDDVKAEIADPAVPGVPGRVRRRRGDRVLHGHVRQRGSRASAMCRAGRRAVPEPGSTPRIRRWSTAWSARSSAVAGST